MTYLVLTMCSLTTPGLCQTERWPLYDATMLNCITLGPSVIATQMELHPGLAPKRWKCERHDQ